MMSTLAVLIVEDDKEVAQNLQLYLLRHFQKVDVAYDGNSAFQAYLDYRYDVMISDIEMPHSNGIALFKKIRKLDPYITLVLFSGHTKETYLLEMVTLKLDAYLIKPITSRKIDEMLLTLQKTQNQDVKVICSHHDLSYSYVSKTFTCGQKTISLTHFEITVIELFLENKTFKITYDMITEALYLGETEVKDRIKNIMKRIRHKIPFIKIIPLPNVGYQLVCVEVVDG